MRVSDVATRSHAIRQVRCPPQQSGPLCVSASCLTVEMKKPPTTEMAHCVSASDSETGGCGGCGGERGGAAVRLFAKPVGSREAELGSKTQRLLLHIRLDRFVLYFDYIVLFFLTET